MDNRLTTNGDALRLFFTEDVYLIKGEEVTVNNEVTVEEAAPAPVIPVLTVNENIAPVKEKPDFKFLGNNKRNILILVNDPENEVSDEKGRELLRKIVKSVNLSANDFALLNYAGYPQSNFRELQEYFSSVLIFAFGVSPAQMGIQHHPDNSIVMEGSIRMIFSSELRKLDQDTNGKKALWGSLQQLGL